jgi:hypothetical protein
MARNKILHLSRPDEKTLAFWRATADDDNEYFKKIAKFSRAIGKNSSSTRRQCALVMRANNAGPLGRLLIMPGRIDKQLRSATRPTKMELNSKKRRKHDSARRQSPKKGHET